MYLKHFCPSRRYRQGSLPNESSANYNRQVNNDCDRNFKDKIDQLNHTSARGPLESPFYSQKKCETHRNTNLTDNLGKINLYDYQGCRNFWDFYSSTHHNHPILFTRFFLYWKY